MNKTLKTILITLGILAAVGGALTAVYFYFHKTFKNIIFVGLEKPEELFIGSEEISEA